MKILIIQEKGRNNRNREFRECCNFQRSIYRQYDNIVVDIWGKGWVNFETPLEKIINNYDAILLLENYDQNGWVGNLSYVNKLKLFWSIDSHVVLQQHLNTCNQHKINIVLCSNHMDMHHFVSNDRKVYSFPSCYPSDLVYPLDIKKQYNIGFCGNINNRGDWLKYIYNNCMGKIDVMKIGPDMVECINSYKIHFNRHISNSREINGRVFETLGCGTFLLTSDMYKIEELFEIGKHLQVYTDINDLKEKIQYYINNEKERKMIEEAGFDHVIRNHSFDVRCKQLINIIKENI